MYSYETKKHTQDVLDRLETSQLNIEKLVFDAINSADKTYGMMKEAMSCLGSVTEESTDEEKIKVMHQIMDLCHGTGEAAKVANVTIHEMEKEIVQQSELVNGIRQIVDFLYGMQT